MAPFLTAHGGVGAVSEGSELWLFNTVPVHRRGNLLRDSGNKDRLDLKHLEIKNAIGSPTRREDMLRIDCCNEFGDRTGESVRSAKE